MVKQFSDVKSLNIFFMFKYMFCNTQNFILTDQCKNWQTNVVFTKITSVFIQFLDEWHEKKIFFFGFIGQFLLCHSSNFHSQNIIIPKEQRDGWGILFGMHYCLWGKMTLFIIIWAYTSIGA